jgi:ATP-dependent DNA helicase RecG
LVHRDYLVSAPIRLFIFDNRIEIISPGHLPNNLTIERIRAGISNIRNPILISFVAKGLLPYHGLGSGVKRALDAWPDIDFTDDREGCLFTVTVHRKERKRSLKMAKKTPAFDAASEKTSGKMEVASGKTSGKILEAIRLNNEITISELSASIGVSERSIERNIQKLQHEKFLLRIGPDKGGHWEIIEESEE